MLQPARMISCRFYNKNCFPHTMISISKNIRVKYTSSTRRIITNWNNKSWMSKNISAFVKKGIRFLIDLWI